MQFGAAKDSQTAADTQALAGASCRGTFAALAAVWALRTFRHIQAGFWLAHRVCACLGFAPAGNTSTGAATFCFIQAIERRGTKLS